MLLCILGDALYLERFSKESCLADLYTKIAQILNKINSVYTEMPESFYVIWA